MLMYQSRIRLALLHTTAIIEVHEQTLARRKYHADECNLRAKGSLAYRAPEICACRDVPKSLSLYFEPEKTRGSETGAKADPGLSSVREALVSTKAIGRK